MVIDDDRQKEATNINDSRRRKDSGTQTLGGRAEPSQRGRKLTDDHFTKFWLYPIVKKAAAAEQNFLPAQNNQNGQTSLNAKIDCHLARQKKVRIPGQNSGQDFYIADLSCASCHVFRRLGNESCSYRLTIA
jgi:hypothetical protein